MQHHTEQHNLTTQHNTAQHDTTLRHIKHYCTPHCSPHHTHASSHQAVRLGVPPTYTKSTVHPTPLHSTPQHITLLVSKRPVQMCTTEALRAHIKDTFPNLNGPVLFKKRLLKVLFVMIMTYCLLSCSIALYPLLICFCIVSTFDRPVFKFRPPHHIRTTQSHGTGVSTV